MKDKTFFTATRIMVFVMGMVIMFLATGCKVSVNEAELADKSLPDTAVLVNTGAGRGGGSVTIGSVDGKRKDSEGKSVSGSWLNVGIIYLEPGEHTILVDWRDGNSSTTPREIKVILPKGSITEIGFENTGGSINYLFRPLEKNQLNELLSFSGGDRSLLRNFHRGRYDLWKRE